MMTDDKKLRINYRTEHITHKLISSNNLWMLKNSFK